MEYAAPTDLVHHIAASTGLPPATANRVVVDVLGYFDETTESYVRRRHTELRGRNYSNTQIWELLSGELACRVVAAPALSARQLRRIVYG